ncbi:MAG: DUF1838 family protein [Rhodospirillaceae bacterium]|nr:DUF1838 family protein [Rhodospirillaceae bacterium]
MIGSAIEQMSTAIARGPGRRAALAGLFGGAAAMAAMGSASSRAATSMDDVRRQYPNFDWDSPEANQRILTRLYATMEPGKTSYLYFFGRGVGTTGPDDYTPLFRMESIAAVRAFPLGNGKIRYFSGQVILFLDWATGKVLDWWKNPYTEEVCEVFHYRDHPVDYTADPNNPAARYSDPTDNGNRRRGLIWNFRKDTAYGDAFVQTKIKNRLDPREWPRESIGEYWTTFEHYQWQGKIAEIVDESLASVPSMYGDVQTFKPFEPWMLMGQRPGKVFQQKSIMKIDGLHQIPRHVADYIEKNLAQYLDLSDIPEGAYKLNDEHYRETHKPKPAKSG